MNLKKALLGMLVASSFGALSLPAQAEVGVVLNFGPPPDRYEVVPAPRSGYVWANGYWHWNGSRHVWVRGTYYRERPGYVYYSPRWVENNGRWEYHSRRWDRDGDGVPNRVDSRPDNPYRQ
jgi:YXWGXW repeat-containing protein